MTQENSKRDPKIAIDVRMAMAIANAVFERCQANVEKWSTNAPNSLNLEEVVAQVLKGTIGIDVDLVRKEVEQSIAFLRSVLIEPIAVKYGPGVEVEVRPSSDDDRILVHKSGCGETVVNYSPDGLSIRVFDGDESRLTPVHELKLSCIELVDRDSLDMTAIAEWVGLHYRINFYTSLMQDEWIERYLQAHDASVAVSGAANHVG